MSNNPFNNYGDDYISSLNNSYRDASVKGRSATMVPEGKYQAYIQSVAIYPSKYFEDELQLAMTFEILAGDQKGAHISKYTSIIPERMEQLKTDLLTLGIDIKDDIRLLGEESTISKMIDQIVDLTVKHKAKNKGGFYQNIYINRSHGKTENFTEVDEDDDDNPFAV